jgi:hypothetical protein
MAEGVKSLVEKLAYIQSETEGFLLKVGTVADAECLEAAGAKVETSIKPVRQVLTFADSEHVDPKQELVKVEVPHKAEVEQRTMDKGTESPVAEAKETAETAPVMKFEGARLSVEKALAELAGQAQAMAVGVDAEEDYESPEVKLPGDNVTMSLEEAAASIIPFAGAEEIPEEDCSHL